MTALLLGNAAPSRHLLRRCSQGEEKITWAKVAPANFVLDRLKNVPVWIFHGRRDDVIPVSWAEELGRRLERCAGKVKVTIYPDAGHDAWTRTYADPAVLEWLLAQRRDPK